MHDIDCEAVETETLLESCKEKGLSGKRSASDFLLTNYVSKLVPAYKRDLGSQPAWCDHLTVGNPVRSDIVKQYEALTTSAPKRQECR